MKCLGLPTIFIATCMLLVAGCTPQATEPLENDSALINDGPAPVESVSIRITGNDGAAFGQIGAAEIGPTDRLRCALLYSNGGDPIPFEADAPGLFAALRDVILANGSAGFVDLDQEDGATYLRAGDYVSVQRRPDFDGQASPLAITLLGLLNADGRACISYG